VTDDAPDRFTDTPGIRLEGTPLPPAEKRANLEKLIADAKAAGQSKTVAFWQELLDEMGPP
jgi:hypothetical protein